MQDKSRTYKTFSDFYPYYLDEHRNRVSRRLHFAGTLLEIGIFLFVLFTGSYLLLILMPFVGYGFAWIGHFFFEKNTPATFRNPLYSLMGDFVMFRDILIGKIRF